ncbi:MAG: hypothetical protein JNM47_11745 [Hyphomonadaceae bacterium]|nr:hypothetical protein [Hyphomonadaceae bacterium]
MAFDGELLSPQFRPPLIDVAPNRFARAPVLDGDVKLQDRLALLFGYACVGAGLGFVFAMVAAGVHLVLVPVVALALVIGALCLARSGLRDLHWAAIALVVVVHLSAMGAVAAAFMPSINAQLAPLAATFAAALVVLAIGFGRWFAHAINFALQALLLAAPFGAALVAGFFDRFAA